MMGRFIVLEGVDGAGTSTQARLLAKALRERGLPVHLTREPSDGPIGVLLRLVIAGRVVVPGVGTGARMPGWRTLALLFAADRLDHLEAEVLPNLRDGVSVVCDRYDYSSVVYQALLAGGDEQAVAWVRSLNRHARRPDLTVVLQVAPEVAARRRRRRSGMRELYDDDAVQRELVEGYRSLPRHFPEDAIVVVDASEEDEEGVAQRVFEVVWRRCFEAPS